MRKIGKKFIEGKFFLLLSCFFYLIGSSYKAFSNCKILIISLLFEKKNMKKMDNTCIKKPCIKTPKKKPCAKLWEKENKRETMYQTSKKQSTSSPQIPIVPWEVTQAVSTVLLGSKQVKPTLAHTQHIGGPSLYLSSCNSLTPVHALCLLFPRYPYILQSF